MEFFYLLILRKCIIASLACAYTLTDEDNLHTALLTGYNKDLRPGIDRTHPLNINASFYLFSINEFDLNIGKFTITGVFEIDWYDERLSWSPASYNQTNMTVIPQNRMWLPNLINVNPYKEIKGLGSDLVNIHILYSGLCSWYALQVSEVICDADVTKYPFDTQFCTLKFFIWGYQPHEVFLNFQTMHVILTLYSENGIWDITDSTTHKKMNMYGYEEIIVGFYLKRRTAYYVVSLLLPINAIQFLLAFVFLLPPESGERLGFSTTILLSIVVYLTIIQDKLPEASEPNVSILSYMLVACVVSGAILILFVILSLRIQSCPCDKPVPRSIVRLVKCCRRKAKCCQRKRNVIDTVEPMESKSEPVVDDEVIWIEVGKCFDVMCFLIFISQISITGIIYLSLVFS
ncbi:acetylcholine receptor subunit alpha-like [Ostrea edulis]|uniref:acetylcholine receptor subunit alpha-like n=1 Tax=Ostrea edulis TaxID=37623 RepID=UPI0024AEF6AC|nr:acetylcholine receptor subunit alpha-like [Ostrea edulis]